MQRRWQIVVVIMWKQQRIHMGGGGSRGDRESAPQISGNLPEITDHPPSTCPATSHPPCSRVREQLLLTRERRRLGNGLLSESVSQGNSCPVVATAASAFPVSGPGQLAKVSYYANRSSISSALCCARQSCLVQGCVTLISLQELRCCNRTETSMTI